MPVVQDRMEYHILKVEILILGLATQGRELFFSGFY
jgi:hypothetical protein